jgi:hypothetical protein
MKFTTFTYKILEAKEINGEDYSNAHFVRQFFIWFIFKVKMRLHIPMTKNPKSMWGQDWGVLQ